MKHSKLCESRLLSIGRSTPQLDPIFFKETACPPPPCVKVHDHHRRIVGSRRSRFPLLLRLLGR